MRRLAFVLALACALPATAQPAATTPPSPEQLARLLGALWRPVPANATGTPEAIFTAACEGSAEEMASVDRQTGDNPTPQSLRNVRSPRGFIIVPDPTEPTHAFLFPNTQLSTIASGPATIAVANAAEARVRLTDAAGRVAEVQMGMAGRQPVMRVLGQGENAPTYVRCASISETPPPANP